MFSDKDYHEIWALAQLLPGEGVVNGVSRIKKFIEESVKLSSKIRCTIAQQVYNEWGSYATWNPHGLSFDKWLQEHLNRTTVVKIE